jgi:hypothetical protein
VWDLGQRATAKAFVAAVFAFFCLLVASCSGESGSSGGGRDTTGQSDDREESTLVSLPGEPETTGEAPLPEATLGPAPDTPAVLLRLEGDPGTTFSGICTVGGKESVLSGRIPESYAFDPREQRLSCRIEKRDSGGGALRVIVIAGDTTRSVQQTNTRGSVINISYRGG